MELNVHKIEKNIFQDLNHRWMALSATDGIRTNSMTAGWGGWGVMWEKDIFFCAVRPCRYTYEILEQTDTITLSFFSDEYKDALVYLGRTSGRDEDKMAGCDLTPITEGKTVYFKEAKLVLTGRILAKTDLKEDDLVDPKLQDFYPKKDYHRIYVCELLRAFEQ